MKVLTITLLTLIALVTLAGPSRGYDNPSDLWPIRQNGKYGYIDRLGKVVFQPQFEEARSFRENLAAVKGKGGWGFINADGRTVVPLQFEAVEAFSQGLALVKKSGKWGFVDKKGTVVTLPQFDWAMGLREDMALVEKGGKYGYVGRDGQVAIAPRFTEAGEFWERLARVKVGDSWGFIDQAGKMVIEPRFPHADNFHEGLAQVEIDGKYGFIDRTGHVAIPPAFDSDLLEWFSEGLAVVRMGKKYGYIDRAGRMVVPPRYWWAWGFQEGAARVQTDDARWVLINADGKIVSEGGFDSIGDFREGLARVRIYTKYGFIGPKGTLAVPVEFSGALPFSEGLAAVHVGGYHSRHMTQGRVRPFDPASPEFFYSKLPFSREKVPSMSGGKGWGYIDRQGRIVIPPGFDHAGSFVGGLAEVSRGDRHGYIDRSGKFIWETREPEK